MERAGDEEDPRSGPWADNGLLAALTRAKDLGFLGPGPVAAHVPHARAFAAAIGDAPDQLVDLGSGAGLPGLVLGMLWPRSTVVLLESSARRAAFLRDAVRDLAIGNGVVVEQRAEDAARSARWRGAADVVVARSFGPPPTTAECGAGFLRVTGRLVVSEPPDAVASQRWPAEGVAALGLRWEATVTVGPAHFAVLSQVEACPDRFPRRNGVPAKRPLYCA